MQQTRWEPHPAGIAGCGVAGVLMAIAAVTVVTDPPGRVLAGVAAAGLLVFAGMSWRARPKLAITPDGLAVRGWYRTQVLQRPDIKIIRIIEFRRYGRTVRLLEVESTDGGLVVLSRWDLGADPLQVLDALTAAGYAGP
ncbi:PH domain-containing protein [Mycobacterium avium subsp. hominissuis]|uniref:PH domain-containing protein n=2 Tax=Mycobacterium avium TaxID=1764 RepID=A0A2A3L7K2_MYCAV|nr:PH domain-containing protein [Mycobacterium avium]APA73843.1 PH domain-containing protein [Mycobacterium avium subsp. hominissuis]AXO21154.1 PH domain-containing protein [Mycobacterium avium subsp. hominissuis]MBG0730029.1 PH domain-containing protein [Mycobacterium avium]MBZ4512766.1 PH domain-containing protein [Mycobacterium avium subsp. hominissuis]MBZ4514024.1 PH domain-containing protein [Mycobacterium avium subsp. hominissuis]